jgi:hypothetical protein
MKTKGNTYMNPYLAGFLLDWCCYHPFTSLGGAWVQVAL